MDALIRKVTLEEFKLFYGLDRDLYIILVRDLCRNPLECLLIMALWLWLEREGVVNVISRILALKHSSINLLADEALICLKILNNKFPFNPEGSSIPVTHSLVKVDVPLEYFQENRQTVLHQIQGLISDIYIHALSDIMEKARHGGFDEEGSSTNKGKVVGHAGASGSSSNPTRGPSDEDALVRSFSGLTIGGEAAPSRRALASESSRFARTMFATFSKGYPVTEAEVMQFFTRIFGNCIESLTMQEVGPGEQALYARVVFRSQRYVQVILNGETKAKFTINGKHVWIRQFVPRNGRMMPCGCVSVGPSTCPDHP